jgi:hypothetical protein
MERMLLSKDELADSDMWSYMLRTTHLLIGERCYPQEQRRVTMIGRRWRDHDVILVGGCD